MACWVTCTINAERYESYIKVLEQRMLPSRWSLFSRGIPAYFLYCYNIFSESYPFYICIFSYALENWASSFWMASSRSSRFFLCLSPFCSLQTQLSFYWLSFFGFLRSDHELRINVNTLFELAPESLQEHVILFSPSICWALALSCLFKASSRAVLALLSSLRALCRPAYFSAFS